MSTLTDSLSSVYSAPYNCVDMALLCELLHCSGMPTVVALHHGNPCGQTMEGACETGVPQCTGGIRTV